MKKRKMSPIKDRLYDLRKVWPEMGLKPVPWLDGPFY
jgi:hypothetical protein